MPVAMEMTTNTPDARQNAIGNTGLQLINTHTKVSDCLSEIAIMKSKCQKAEKIPTLFY